MIEVRKPWKQEGFGGAKEGPLTQAWMQMKIDQVDPIDVDSQALKHVLMHSSERWSSNHPEDLARWAAIQEAAAKFMEQTLDASTCAESKQVKRNAQPTAPRIEIAPGYGFCRFIGGFLPKRFRENVLETLLADAMQDYYDACEAQDDARARRIRYMVYVWILYSILKGIIPMLFGMLKGPMGASKE